MSAEAMPGKQILLPVLLLFARNAVEVLMICTLRHKKYEALRAAKDVRA